MKTVKQFEEYLQEGVAKTITPDIQRAESLRLESQKKFTLLQEQIKKLGVNDENANDYIEYCYNIIMFLIRAEMLTKGYNSTGQGAHEAEVAYARNMKLSEAQIQLLNQLRYFRNGILYYGKQFDKVYAKTIIEFTTKLQKQPFKK